MIPNQRTLCILSICHDFLDTIAGMVQAIIYQYNSKAMLYQQRNSKFTVNSWQNISPNFEHESFAHV